MPCDLGYKSYIVVRLPKPQPKQFKKKIQSPKIDAELLSLIGADEPEFVEWLNDMKTKPLLEEALRRAFKKVSIPKGLRFSVDDGSLIVIGAYTDAVAKAAMEEASRAVGERYQMEILTIVAQLLDYEVIASVAKDGSWTIKGEKEQEGVEVNAYLEVTKDADGGAMMFEHFQSAKARDLEQAKFLATAQKLGLKISVGERRASGSPIPGGAHHKHFLKEGGRA